MYMNKPATLLAGIVMLIIGLVLTLFPAFTMSIITVLVGVALLAGSINAFIAWNGGMKGTLGGSFMLILGILALVMALVCILHPFATASTFTWLIALCIVITGIAQIITLVATPALPGRTLGIVGAVLVVVFGICAMSQPAMVMQFIGISLIIDGVSVAVMACMPR